MPWLVLALLFVLALAASPASAGTPLPRKTPSQRWHGCTPPDTMKPRPLFACGDELTDNSTNVDRRVKVKQLAGAPVRGGYWLWTYYLTDGTFAHADSLRR